jgi:hypothetical protein
MRICNIGGVFVNKMWAGIERPTSSPAFCTMAQVLTASTNIEVRGLRRNQYERGATEGIQHGLVG